MHNARPTGFDRLSDFVSGLEAAEIPVEVRHFASLLLLDTLGVAAAARDMEPARIARAVALQLHAAGPGAAAARMLFDGRAVSVAGAAFAAAAQIDNLDAHDGYNPTKGHLGVALVPALMAFAETRAPESGEEALIALIAGYEVGARAGIALHATASDYHTSGAWNALGVATVGARLRRMPPGLLREALGIAEYHGPRSQMMRVIDHPTMLRDGSAWGALAGVSAVYMAEMGFSGAPAVTVEGADVEAIWRNLGQDWVVARHYIKPYPVCRWVHALIEGALRLRGEHGLDADDIVGVELRTFAEAARLYRDMPGASPVAQYSICFPVASALVNGRLSVTEITGAGLTDPQVRRLVEATTVHASADYSSRFPASRFGDVTLHLRDGRRIGSGSLDARGGPENPLTEDEIVAKFRDYAGPAIGRGRADAIEAAVRRLAESGASFAPVLELCCGA